MPELPEVEHAVRTLVPHLKDKKISKVDVLLHRITPQGAEYFTEKMEGSTFKEFSRRGKFLIFTLVNTKGEKLFLVSHFRMTGRLVYSTTGFSELSEINRKHSYVRIELSEGWLYFCEPRQFGQMLVFDEEELSEYDTLRKMGPEALDEDGFWEFLSRFRNKTKFHGKFIKESLLDQELVAGIGNIYAAESLHAAGIHPTTYGYLLTDDELLNIWEKNREIMLRSIELGGTSVSDYQDGNGEVGSFQEQLKVYGRDTCGTCGESLQKLKLSGRATHCCLVCQPPRKEKVLV